MYWQVKDSDYRFKPDTFAQQPVWLVTQALRAIKRQQNTQAYAAARNTLMLYNIKKDPKKESDEVTVANFLPHPEIWIEDNTVIDLNITARAARQVLRYFDKLPNFAKFIVEPNLTQYRILSRK